MSDGLYVLSKTSTAMMAEKKQLLSQHIPMPVVHEVILGPHIAVLGYLKSVLRATESEDRAEHPKDCELFLRICSKLRSPLTEVSNPLSILVF